MSDDTKTPAESPAAIAAITPLSPSVVKPGWKTTEAWFTFAVLVLSGLLSSGLIGELSDTGKLIALALGIAKALGYTGARTFIKNAAALLLILGVAHSTGCAPSARQVAIRDGLIATDTAAHSFAVFDAYKQQSIVDGAKTREDGEQSLSAWRVKQTIVSYTVQAAYRTLALAATDNQTPIEAVSAAVKLVVDTVTQIKGETK